MNTDGSNSDVQDAAERQFVDMVRRLVAAARDGRPHLSHDGGATCMGCRAVREGLNFVHFMTDGAADADQQPEAEPAPVLELSVNQDIGG